MRRDLLATLAITALLLGLLLAATTSQDAAPAPDEAHAFRPAGSDSPLRAARDAPPKRRASAQRVGPRSRDGAETSDATHLDAAPGQVDPATLGAGGPTVVFIGQDDAAVVGQPAPLLSQEERDRLPAQPFGPDAGWADPTQQEILGPPRWMAQPSQGDARALAAAIDAGPAPGELRRQEDTRSLREGAGLLVIARSPRCVDKWRARDPALRGQLIVDVSVVATAGAASLTDVRIHAPILIEESGLSECVRSTLQGARFVTRAESTAPVTFSFPVLVR